MKKTLFITTLLLSAGAMFTSCNKDVENPDMQAQPEETAQVTRAYGDKTPLIEVYYEINVDSDIGTFGRRMFGSIFHIAVLRGLREVRCREPDTGIVRQSRSRNAVVYRGKRVRRICGRRRVASFQTSGVLLRGGVETPGLRPGAYGKPAIDARLRVRCLAAAGP